ncbi:unnamed protein product [Pleuronectes platessa]|uniref:Uncharacterized protein n=1 Tax=Pleuronectes platessa TaxID=8262 RepID=A0A9N7W0A4_PLEPL|nr:unnamed protein product [Pleuronectes platessa]
MAARCLPGTFFLGGRVRPPSSPLSQHPHYFPTPSGLHPVSEAKFLLWFPRGGSLALGTVETRGRGQQGAPLSTFTLSIATACFPTPAPRLRESTCSRLRRSTSKHDCILGGPRVTGEERARDRIAVPRAPDAEPSCSLLFVFKLVELPLHPPPHPPPPPPSPPALSKQERGLLSPPIGEFTYL